MRIEGEKSMAEKFVRAARLEDVRAAGCVVVNLDGQGIALFAHDESIYAIDNRCPHMGFPLHRGTLKDGILTCHWHHARFDLASGGTFDQFADDVRAFPTLVRDGDVWVDLAPRGDPRRHQQGRLRDGLERDIPLVIAKAVVFLLEAGEDPAEPFRIGLDFGTRYRSSGWGPGLTMHTALMNLLDDFHPADRPRALYSGLSAVARDTTGEPARFVIRPLPTSTSDIQRLTRWFRQFVEVRDAEGAERCIVSALRAGAHSRELAALMFAAATDHRYLSTGHVVDFTNKAFEALDVAGWDYAELALTSLAGSYASADRMEESNSWRHPVDLIAILEDSFAELPVALEKGAGDSKDWAGEDELIDVLVGEDPRSIADALLASLAEGASATKLASAVVHAAALRITRFHMSNEFSDWDTALHTLSFAHAVRRGLERAPSRELTRGVFDAAMSVYLDRFLNVPATRLPSSDDTVGDPETILRELPALLDRQQQVNRAGNAVARYLYSGGDPDLLVAGLGSLLLREDRDFHTIQTVEVCIKEFRERRGTKAGVHMMVAAARYLAAHSPTVRAQGQTYQIAVRLSRGETLFEE
jgi:nitrite reductase/ring-hydroxylating ferredoxin subunit